MSGPVGPTTPVLVGVGTASQKCEDHTDAAEPLELMRRALDTAGRDAGAPSRGGHGDLLGRIEHIAVPHGRWDYGDPGRLLAPGATTVLAEVGVLQQSLISECAQKIADGEIAVAAVVGGEAGHRIRQAARAGTEASETADDGVPDVHRTPDAELRLPVEATAGLSRAVGYYAVLEAGFRARHGLGLDESRDRIAAMYSRFSEVATGNPDAWRPRSAAPAEIRDAGPSNPMMAFPYTRSHTSSWSVDQAGALLLCSAGVAEEIGVPRERWVFPVVAAESNHMVNVCRRADLGDSPGARAVAAAVLDHAGSSADDLDLVDLYSCFPVAVEMFADALGVSEERALTVTGGMPWAGGPYNNYVLQATCRMAEQIRADGGTGLVSCVSGLMTKQAAAIWSSAPPSRPFASLDVTAQARESGSEVEVVDEYTGSAVVAGYTVLHIPGKPDRGVAVLDLPDGRRTMARCEDPDVTAAMETEEWCGRRVDVDGGAFR
ncbi:acetyl-CoA C-acetyltransferase [Pseudonocardia sediminis]|uniref:Acetyl-CoA C-acetyltransferase n=1 Tax=Pseudonocardia sediminis TaxID=1397368 RepID=A0A4Q7V260_PSEST|nr:acetyl-CoA acetyltransferase [Pseudonocardia sediminis]RZT86703.1 acetyl-CoA C-acetyltransferase [Pseudonocardia sediminis]